MIKRNQAIRNKNKGSNAERLYAQRFREIGYPLCKTSRYASRLHDDAKIDLVHIPFNIQVKAGKQTNLNPAKELFLMENCIRAMFPEYDSVHNFPKMLIHHKHVGPGFKRTEEDVLIYMSQKQFVEYEKQLGKLEFLGKKKSSIQTTSEFNSIVWVSFKYFVNNILMKLNGNKKG